MRSHADETFTGMSDSDCDFDCKAIREFQAVCDALRNDAGYPRIAAATLLRSTAKQSELRSKALNDFALALLDEQDIETTIHDHAPNIDQWEADIREARGRA